MPAPTAASPQKLTRVIAVLLCVLLAGMVFACTDDNGSAPVDSGSDTAVDTGDPDTGADLDIGTPDGSGDPVEPDPPVDPRTVAAVPSSPTMQRLTRSQYARTIHDLFSDDIILPDRLEPDVEAGGLLAVGAGTATISPRGVEQYEQAAFDIAEQALDDEHRERIVRCEPSGTVDDACAGESLSALGRRAWRRPLTDGEVEQLVGIAAVSADTLGDFYDGLVYAVATLLQSPHFLFRVERGTDGPGDARPLSNWELAARLSYFLWNTTPDDELLDAAAAGELTTDEGLEAQAMRLLDSPRARVGVRAFVTDFLRLYELDELRKDPDVFVHMSHEVGPSAREETLRLFEWLFTTEGDYRDVFTTRTTFVNRVLASIYDIAAPSRDGFGQTELPADSPRRGLLGQISFLAGQAHATSSSATLRGVFIREVLLCSQIPPPPANVDTSLPEADADAPTLRERVEIHMGDPACAGCHALMDPIGLAMENFDGIGRFRETENDAVIDASGELDGEPFSDAAELGELMHDHPRVPGCLVRTAYRYAVGHVETREEVDVIDALTADFAADGYRIRTLLLEIVMSQGFRTTGPTEPQEETP